MANLKSSKKRARQNLYRHQVNLARKTAIKTIIKKVLAAVAKGKDSFSEAESLFRNAQAKLARAKSKGVMHANTVARKVSALAKKIGGLRK